jgi:hypothetical protein
VRGMANARASLGTCPTTQPTPSAPLAQFPIVRQATFAGGALGSSSGRFGALDAMRARVSTRCELALPHSALLYRSPRTSRVWLTAQADRSGS